LVDDLARKAYYIGLYRQPEWPKMFRRSANPANFCLAEDNTGGLSPRFNPKTQLFNILAFPAAIFSLSDAFLTRYLVGIGRVREGNPMMAKLLADNQFLWFKVIGVGLCMGLLWKVSMRFPRLAGWTALFITAFYCGVLIWNSSVLATT